MNKFLPVVITVLGLAVAPQVYCADAKVEMDALVGKVKTQLQAGKNTAADLAPDFQEFDALLAEHKGEKTDEVANILLMKAMLHAQVLEDNKTATQELQQLKTDFPNTAGGKQADLIIARLGKQDASNQIKSGLVVGSAFPNFQETSFDGKPLSVSAEKGKIVLIDFWATWCGPCVGELPNVQKVYAQYHDKDFDIIGVSLDKDKDKLTSFLKEKGMPWPQYFDGKGWANKVSTSYGIDSIPATYLLDKEGKIIGKGLRGAALDAAVKTALAAN